MISFRIRRLATTASTNDDARQAAEAGEAEGLVIHALSQSAGRGRHGRVWNSPEGNLYCSVLLCPSDARNYGFYSFVAALALADTVRQFLPDADVALKWPNDVLVAGKKISGILLEGGTDYLIVGMGLNILHHPENALYPATSLTALGAEKAGADRILSVLLAHLQKWHQTLQNNGFAPIRAVWLERAQKGRMMVKLPEGTVQGEFKTIDEQGRLILHLADGSERVLATGDVFSTQAAKS